MSDLAQRIRDRLDEWARPSGEAPPVFTEPADIDPEQAAVIQAAWDMLLKADPGPHRIVVLPPSPFDLMRRAILAVVDLHAADAVGFCGECSDEFPAAWPCPTVRVIAENLVIEVGDGRP